MRGDGVAEVQQIIQRKEGYSWSIMAERRRRPGGSLDRYDYDVEGAEMSGSTRTLEEAKRQIEEAKRFLNELLKR
ncbi:MAG: hypothetical protein QXT26_06235 [Thermoproteota archaeon]